MERSFVIVDPNPVVTLDLQGILATAFPSSPVSIWPSLADGYEISAPLQGPVAAFVSSSVLSTPNAMDVLRTLVTGGGQAIVIGSPVELDFPAVCIDTPFTTEMILSTLANDANGPPEPPPASHT